MNNFSQNKNEISDAIKSAYDKNYNSFMSWFNASESFEMSMIRGTWDFSSYFITPDVCRYISEPEKKKCLEIGYGGGRLLHASRNFFQYSYGVDIHPYSDFVRQKLIDRSPCEDFSLIQLKNDKFPLKDNSIHYVYSFIVIQHFYSIEILQSYLAEISRVLVSGGLVNLFFADLFKYSSKCSLFYLNSLMAGYMEIPNPPNEKTANNTLWVSLRWVKKRLSELGFKIISHSPSYKGIPDGYPLKKGSQTGILAQLKS